MTRIDVATPSRPYGVTIEANATERLGAILDEIRAPARRFVVSSPLVWRLHGSHVARTINASDPILIPDGERHKQLATVTRVYDALVRANADRATTLITLGGGVIGDMAGIPASQLAVLPGTSHVGLLERTNWLQSMILEFLDAPEPRRRPSAVRER